MSMSHVVIAVCLIASFFIGGIPFGLILGRMKDDVDIREAGSGNIGTTNALRVLGPKIAAATLLLDCLKGVACIVASRFVIAWAAFGGDELQLTPGGPGDHLLGLVALACVCGHVFSPYLHFRGGKGIAVGLGVLLGWYWPIACALLGLFAIGVALTRYVSVGSILAALGVPVAVAFAFPYASISLKLIMSLIGVLIIWAHRANIKKLISGSESKLSLRGHRCGDGDGDEKGADR
ncbi:acyl-phosphate glycerol-3-phosphate acyltransferase [Coriobacterium glomerans PW2]|uniref:Glycerol-3-phosphate acyltransferase n=1 Tax=Coriobacterium glomerans (strain ATCC 49209 / DSM 20642 / JCM 10262 / PW2) TaxID=700015 RepID=F2N9J2_CORGP|nr:glycerol-3-phosphate 1-O-acyltransferase PlsY [Coriobacterium glomerans]AEB07021.1 acyl-phosphate glycerol-3-phosphate acyltransferase [Coriobacterium glomerans PW2]